MKHDEFEQDLGRRPMRAIPGDWRADILAAAQTAQPLHQATPVPSSWLSTIYHQLSTLFWPHPRAWAGVAAVWALIFFLHFASRETAPSAMETVSTPSPDLVAELRQQQTLYAELIGSTEVREADRPKDALPRPRTERQRFLTV